MPRAIWSGAISFGLVTIPVKLFNGVSTKSVRFNQIHEPTGARIKRKWVSSIDGSDLDSSELVRGFEITKGNYVIISDEELEALDPPSSRAIDIMEFVDQDEIDPRVYANAYYLAPDELAMKAYKVLADALEESNKVAIAKMVMRTKQYIAAVRPADGVLMLSTMVYADEVNAIEDIDGLAGLDAVEVRQPEIDMAMALIDSLSADFEHEKYSDEHRERVMEMIQLKSNGELTSAPIPVVKDDGKVVDLMAALEASVAAAKQARGRHPSVKDEVEVDDGTEEAADAEDAEVIEVAPAAKKASAKKKPAAKKPAAKKPAAKKPAAKKPAAKKPAAKKPARKSA